MVIWLLSVTRFSNRRALLEAWAVGWLEGDTTRPPGDKDATVPEGTAAAAALYHQPPAAANPAASPKCTQWHQSTDLVRQCTESATSLQCPSQCMERQPPQMLHALWSASSLQGDCCWDWSSEAEECPQICSIPFTSHTYLQITSSLPWAPVISVTSSVQSQTWASVCARHNTSPTWIT